MAENSRTPVLVGCGQLTQRIDDPREADEPLRLMLRSAELAAEDAAAPGLLSSLDAVRVPQGIWPYRNPAGWLGEQFGAGKVDTGIGPISGNTVQLMLHHAANEIAAGKRDVVLLAAAEAERSKRRAAAQQIDLDWTEVEGGEPDENFPENDPAFGWLEKTHRVRPVQMFSMFENALRHARGESLELHRARIASLWARFAKVAASNPFAWIQDAPSAESIATPGAKNPMLAYPYTKFLVANMVVDEGAALIVCSLEAARRHGVPEDRLVYLHAGVDVTRVSKLPERLAYHDQPAIGLGGRRALELAQSSPDAIDHVDLYSCFPSAVQIAADEIGFGLSRDLTVTGGLTFSGGPFNSYVMHSIAATMLRLRSEAGSLAFVSGVGGYMAKHAFSVLGAAPPAAGYRYDCPNAASLALPTRECLREYAGPALIETFCVMPDAAGVAHHVLAACRTADESRAFATCADPSLLESLEREELCGRSVTIAADGVMEVQG